MSSSVNLDRLDDDGGCVLPINIGIATEAKLSIFSPSGQPFNAPQAVLSGLVDQTGETLNTLTWDKYLAWRKTKCRPYDYVHGPGCATGGPAIPPRVSHDSSFQDRALEEIDQATHEFVGEVAELGELILQHGAVCFVNGEQREKLIDEIGDIFFCGVWALDAWGVNPLYGEDDLEIIRVEEDSDLAGFANVFIANEPEVVLANNRFLSVLGGLVFNLMVHAQTSAGLLCNSFKKLRFQRREQSVDVQLGRIVNVFQAVNQLLVVANSSVEEALKSNMRKLNARFPDGYKPGVGGGIRTGEGK